jgi:ribosomal protein L11 methyltransferase
LIRLAVRVKRGHAELVLAELLELAPGGVEEVDLGDHTEYAVYGPPGELPSLPALRAAAGEALVEIDTTEIPDDWDARWRQFHRPVLVSAPRTSEAHPAAPSIRVRPPWEASHGGRDDVAEIVIDPGQAFGTGTHPTTRLCLELLLELVAQAPADGGLIDVGTGSGVLAIAAAKLGFTPVLALDNDPQSLDAARENAACNGVEIRAQRFDLRAEPLSAGVLPSGGAQAPVVVCNLLRGLLIELSRTIRFAPRALIASGLLIGEADEVVRAFTARLGMRERERRTSGEWEAVSLAAP